MAKLSRISRLAVTFHVPPNSSPEASAIFLEKSVNELFDSSGIRIRLSNQITEEIMYSIQLPLSSSTELLEEFFRNLKRLLSRTSVYNPHFTQLPDLLGSRK